jgi:hypothetical protein
MNTAPSKQQRRTLRFDTLEQVLQDAEKLVQAEHIEQAGNWTLAQCLMHLALSARMSMDGSGPTKRNLIVKFIGPIIKRRIIKHGMKPGFKLPENRARLLVPKEKTKLDSAWDALQRQLKRMETHEKFQPHPVFGPMTRDEWLQLTLRHAELHLSFLRVAD